MARGDITTIIVANAADQAATVRQPASGVEEMIMDSGAKINGTTPNGVSDTICRQTDGTNTDAYMEAGKSHNMVPAWWRATHFIDNTNYFQHSQATGGNHDHTFSVIVVG